MVLQERDHRLVLQRLSSVERGAAVSVRRQIVSSTASLTLSSTNFPLGLHTTGTHAFLRPFRFAYHVVVASTRC
jgi:hypothetical protein